MPESAPEVTETVANAVTQPPKSAKWLFVLCTASDYATIPPGDTQAFYQKLLATPGTGGLADYWKSQSNGNVDITGSVVTNWTPTSDTSVVGSDGRRWINPNLSAQTVIQDCVNTQSGRSDFGSFYNYVAVWNVIVGSQGGIGTTIAGKTVNALKMDVGADGPYWQHEMGHGFTLGHSRDDTFGSCSGGPGEYCNPFDDMSALNWRNTNPMFNGPLCINTYTGAPFTSDCRFGPGLDLWNQMQLKWTVRTFATAAWPNSFNSTVTLAPINHPELTANWMGLYVPAHQNSGYTVEFITRDGWEAGISQAPVLVVNRVFSGDATPYWVTAQGGSQVDFSHPFIESNPGGGGVSISLVGINSGNPPTARVAIAYSGPGPAVWWGGDYGYPRVSPPALNDWSPGNYKGECEMGQSIVGISRFPNALQSHALQCGPRTLSTTNSAGSGCYTRTATAFDNRGDNDNGWDWDPGSYKYECAANEYVQGVSQGGNGVLASILCCPANVTHQSCKPEIFYSGDSADYRSPDWDPGYYKGQCPSGQYMAGVSSPAFASVGAASAMHGLLCCAP
jgi:hypothetical protein